MRAGALCVLLALGFAAACLGKQGGVSAQPDLLFKCSFNGAIKPEITQNPGEPIAQGELQFTKGLIGQALITSHTQGCSFPLHGNVNLAAGTIKLWVSPLDWQVGDGLFHHWFRIVGDQPEDRQVRPFDLLLYKFLEWDTVLAYGMCGELTGSNSIQLPMNHLWAPKRWHQIAFTWDETGATLYMDGEGQRRQYIQAPPNAFTSDSIIIGGPYFAENPSHSAVDELAIYGRKLSGQEIQDLYRTELITSAMTRDPAKEARP